MKASDYVAKDTALKLTDKARVKRSRKTLKDCAKLTGTKEQDVISTTIHSILEYLDENPCCKCKCNPKKK